MFTAGHPPLGERRDLPGGEVSFEISTSEFPWLPDHEVFGRVVAPASLYGAQAVAALGSGPALVEEARIERPLVLPARESGDDAAWSVQLVLGKEDGSSSRSWEVFSRGSETEAWVLHAAGRVRPAASFGVTREKSLGIERLKGALRPLPVPELYRWLAAGGLQYGPSFRGLQTLWGGDSEALGEIALPDGVEDTDARSIRRCWTLPSRCSVASESSPGRQAPVPRRMKRGVGCQWAGTCCGWRGVYRGSF